MRSVLGTSCCLAVLLGAVVGMGCRDKEPAAPKPSAQAPAATSAPATETQTPPSSAAPAPGAVAPSSPPSGASSAALSLSIVPAFPRATDCLQAVIVGVTGDLTLQWLKNGKTVEGATTTTICGERLTKGDTITVTGSSSIGSQSASVTVRNTPPRVQRLIWRPTNITRGSDLTASAEGLDADGDAVSFNYCWLINGNEFQDARGATLPGTSFRGGDKIRLEITPSDGQENGEIYHSGELTILNSPPVFVTSAPNTAAGSEYVYDARAEDADGQPLTYRLEEAPAGMTIDAPTGRIRWPLKPATVGEHKIKIAVQDPSGGVATQSFTLELGLK